MTTQFTPDPVFCQRPGCSNRIRHVGAVCKDGHCGTCHTTHPALPEDRHCACCGQQQGEPALDKHGRTKSREDGSIVTVSILDGVIIHIDDVRTFVPVCKKCLSQAKSFLGQAGKKGMPLVMPIQCALEQCGDLPWFADDQLEGLNVQFGVKLPPLTAAAQTAVPASDESAGATG